MALATYKCLLDRTDRIFPVGATFSGGIRIRPGETVEVDLEESDQDDAFTQENYEEIESPLEPPIHVPFDS